jgi:hypothetical protein
MIIPDLFETNDYFDRRRREEDIISGQKPPRKKQSAQTSDYSQRRQKQKAADGIATGKIAEQGVAEGSLAEMDKSAPQPGRDGRVSHSTYGSRDKGGSNGPEKEVKPITAKKAKQDALDILKKQGVAEGKLNFEEGDCPIFAIALHRLSKMPLMALVEYDEQMGSTVLIHAYVKLDDRWRLDASGETDVNWMLQKYPNNGNAEEIEISEKDLLELGYGKSKCPTLQQVLPHAKEVLQNIEEGQQGVTEGLNEFAQGDFNGGNDSNDLQLYLDVAKKLNMKKYKPSVAHDLIAKKMAELVDAVDHDKVDWARHMARKAQGLSNMLDQQGVTEGFQKGDRVSIKYRSMFSNPKNAQGIIHSDLLHGDGTSDAWGTQVPNGPYHKVKTRMGIAHIPLAHLVKQDVAEGYKFTGGFPFDVDHMPGAVHKQGLAPARPTTSKKFFHDQAEWQRAVDQINSTVYDDNSEFVSGRGVKQVTVNDTVWAKWSDKQNRGYIDMGTMAEQGVTEGSLNEWLDPGAPCKYCGKPHGLHTVKFDRKNPNLSFMNPDNEWSDLDVNNAEDHEYTPTKNYRPLSQREAELVGFHTLSSDLPDDIYDRINSVRQRIARVGKNAGNLTRVKEQGVTEGFDESPKHLLHKALVYNRGADKLKAQYERDGDTGKLIANIQKLAKSKHGMNIATETAKWIAKDLVHPARLHEDTEEGLDDMSTQQAIIDTVERLFRKNNLSDYGSLEAVRQGVKHHFSKPGATAESAITGVLNILSKRMAKSGNYVDLGRFKEALRQGIAHQLKKQGVAEGSKQRLPIVMYKEISPDMMQGRDFYQVVQSQSPFWKVGKTFSDDDMSMGSRQVRFISDNGAEPVIAEGTESPGDQYEIYNLRTDQALYHPFEAPDAEQAYLMADDWLEAIGRSGRGLGVRRCQQTESVAEGLDTQGGITDTGWYDAYSQRPVRVRVKNASGIGGHPRGTYVVQSFVRTSPTEAEFTIVHQGETVTAKEDLVNPKTHLDRNYDRKKLFSFFSGAMPITARQAYNLMQFKQKAKEPDVTEQTQRLDPKCWSGYKKDGTKVKGGVRVNNCVPRESAGENTDPRQDPYNRGYFDALSLTRRSQSPYKAGSDEDREYHAGFESGYAERRDHYS